MPPKKRDNDYMDVDSDSDKLLSDDELYEDSANKKGKGKAAPKKGKGKGKGKITEVSTLQPSGITRGLSNHSCEPECMERFVVVANFATMQQPYAWEASYTRSWETVQEDEGGSLQSAVNELLARGRRRLYVSLLALSTTVLTRFLVCSLHGPTTAIRRTIIRHLVLILDLSASMLDRDMRPTRFDLTLEYSRSFVSEWFDQNPLGQIGVVGMRGGVGERVADMSGEYEHYNAERYSWEGWV